MAPPACATRGTETSNNDFGARYFSFRIGRWLSADWSAVLAPVPYANLSNPQTPNLYAMVSDNPETFADLDGHGSVNPSNNALTWFWGCNANLDDGCPKDQTDPTSQDTTAATKVTTSNENHAVNVSVAVVDEPQFIQNDKLDFTGTGAILSYTFNVSSGNPLAGVSVSESNTTTLTVDGKEKDATTIENPGKEVTDAKGSIDDTVSTGGRTSKMPFTLNQFKTLSNMTPTTMTSVQNQTVTVGKTTYNVKTTRTLSNVDSKGNLNTKLNGHGSNFTITVSKPVITPQ